MSNNKNQIQIIYCTQCRWLLRATWISQELLTTFDSEINELTLVPGTGGVFDIYANSKIIWSRKEQGRFAELKELKQRIRDIIAPEKNLGHSDNK